MTVQFGVIYRFLKITKGSFYSLIVDATFLTNPLAHEIQLVTSSAGINS